MQKQEYLRHTYLCEKKVNAEVSIIVNDNASEDEIKEAINKAMYKDDIEWDYYGKYEIIEEADVIAVSKLPYNLQ